MKKYAFWFVFSIWFLSLAAQPVPVEVVFQNGQYQLLRGGESYFVKGAGGTEFIDRVRQHGGNSIRTWGIGNDTQAILDAAQANGLTVLVGLWVGHQAHGFNYDDEAAVQRQLEDFRRWVIRYKDHPAVLAWGIGNEVELGLSVYNLKVWNAINDIAKMIHEEDGQHPTLTVTAGIDVNKARIIKERAPDLDIIGVNAYGSIGGVSNALRQAEWDIPYLITEWGPNGQWESPLTAWRAPIEPSSTDKAQTYSDRYENIILKDTERCIGSYVFLWGSKFEQTPTWYGLFVKDEATQVVEVMQAQWTGQDYTGNHAPRILEATINGRSAGQSPVLTAEKDNVAIIRAEDPDGDPLSFEFIFRPEEGSRGLASGPTFEGIPGLIVQQNGNTITFNTPENLTNYRLFMLVRDGQGGIATVNVPFRTELGPLVSDDPNILFANQDAYMRDGEFSNIRHGQTDPQRLQTRLRNDPPNSGFNRETYIGFDCETAQRGITSVHLEVFGGELEGVTVAAFGLPNFPWSENTLRWSVRNNNELPLLDQITINTPQPRYYRWDVTDYVREQLILGETDISFALRNLNESANPVNWNARERREHPPRLVFVFNDGPLDPPGDSTLLVQNLFPNPTADALHLEFYKPGGTAQIQVEVFDIQGRLAQTRTFPVDRAARLQTLDLSRLQPGVYVLRITANEQRQHLKFVKK